MSSIIDGHCKNCGCAMSQGGHADHSHNVHGNLCDCREPEYGERG